MQCENLVKIYKISDIEVFALQGLDLEVEKGEIMGIIGNSGSGKSTLLNIIGGLDRPSAGTVIVDGKDLLKMSDRDLMIYRRDTVGFVWQNNARNMIPYLTAVENVEMPMLFKGTAKRQKALELLEMVGLINKKSHTLHELSGGEQQRTAIAIALANSPKVLLADEPTGNVDTKTYDSILALFRELSHRNGQTVIIVTHDLRIARNVDRVVAIRDGKTSSEFLRKKTYIQELNEISAGISPDSGENEDTHDEYALLDKAGRVQIPRDFLDKTGIGRDKRIRMEVENDVIVIKKTNNHPE